MHFHPLPSLLCLLLLLIGGSAGAQVPGILSYQGRITAGGVPFTGTGLFKFALVSAAGNTTFWSHDGSSSSGSQPSTAVSLAVTSGLYAVLLGIPASSA